MLSIRLARVGTKKKPAYRVVVIDKRRARDSKNIEIVGHYNPTTDPITLSLKDERIAFWRGKGAQPSTTVQRLLTYQEKGGATYQQPSGAEPVPAEAVEAAAEAAPPVAPAEESPSAAAESGG